LQERETMKTTLVYLGIDVSKSKLHLASPSKFLGEFTNDAAGHRKLVEKVKQLGPERIVLEASGGYERLVTEALQDAQLPVSVCQPGCIRHFALSIKQRAKTDQIDAQLIARFGEATNPDITPKTPENVRKMRALTDRRQQVIEDRVREENRLLTCVDREIRREIEASIDKLNAKQKELDEQIAQLEQTPAFCQKAEAMKAQKGVGDHTARVLLAQLPELGRTTRQEIASLAGLAPYPRESGQWKGKRTIYGGRATVRMALFMAARSAARWCPVLSVFYNRLRNNGKSFKAAIIACARKLLVRLNTIIKNLDQNTRPGAAAT